MQYNCSNGSWVRAASFWLVLSLLSRSLLGDNTDWLGIARPLAPLLAQGPAQQDDTKAGVALVVGAGGTARAALFALQQLGYGGSSLLVFNRTYSRAVSVADQFSATAVKALEDIVAHIDVVVCTVPGDAGFTLPTHLLKQQPVVFDVVCLGSVSACLKWHFRPISPVSPLSLLKQRALNVLRYPVST